jgi:hypothetical protein
MPLLAVDTRLLWMKQKVLGGRQQKKLKEMVFILEW